MVSILPSLLWTVLAALAAALVVTAWSWRASTRRRREHATVLRDAVAAMCAQRPGRPGRISRLHRDVVEILARQNEGAGILDRAPRADIDRLVAAPDDDVLLASAEAATAPRTMRGRTGNGDDDKWPPSERLPTVADHLELADLHARTQRTTERRIARATLVLAQAARLGEPQDPACRDRLRAAFERGAAEARAAQELAASGDVLGALRILTGIDLPVPEFGVPGQADLPDMRAQTNALARLALRHRAAIAAHLAGTEPASAPAEGEESA